MARKKGGLEDVVAVTSSICAVDGVHGKLSYRGIDIHELATNSTYEETAYLLWNGELPAHAELTELELKLASSRELPSEVQGMVTGIARSWEPMETLRTAVSALSGFDPGNGERNTAQDFERAVQLTARMPVIVAAHHRGRQKLRPVAPRQDLRAAANFLYMLTGKLPQERTARILDIALVVHADHELNASTFAARVAASTLADVYSATSAAIATLDGPLHGGANERVMQMFERIGDPSRAESYVLDLLAKGKRVPGFGHRVYKGADPRATEMRPLAAELANTGGEGRFFEISQRVEDVVKREKGLNANLDFISALVYHGLGIPTDLMTPLFACARVAGWTAHVLEQYADNRLIRPRAEYVGPSNVPYVPVDERERKVA